MGGCPNLDILEVEENSENNKFVDKEMENELRRCGIPERFINASFSNTESRFNELLKKFCLTGSIEGKSIVILAGNNGTGKSRLAGCCIRHRYDNGLKAGTYISCKYEVCPLIRSSRSFKAEKNELDTLNYFYKNPFLVLDETGKGDDNIIAKSFIEMVLSARYDNDLPTLITTNLTKDELIEFVGKDVSSRFKESALFYIVDGDDKRGM